MGGTGVENLFAFPNSSAYPKFPANDEKVRVVTYYGVDNQIDGIVLEVLLKKHKKIRSSLGVSVPVPANTNASRNKVRIVNTRLRAIRLPRPSVAGV